MEGYFRLRVARGTVIEVTYIGFKSAEKTALIEQPMQFTLELQAASADEFVVVGYGTVRKTDLTGSLSQVKSKEINAFPATNIMQALNGRAAGVRVIQNGGSPGGGVSVRIRGTNSILGGNEPLYVIDGFPYDGNPTFLQNADIESMEILKDASSTAIYGSRGANGVVMITTKAGRKGDRTTVDIDAGYTNQFVSRKMNLMNARNMRCCITNRPAMTMSHYILPMRRSTVSAKHPAPTGRISCSGTRPFIISALQ